MKGISKNKIKWSIVNNRLPKTEYKEYYINQLNIFCGWFNSKKIKYIHFGRQDIRGVPSITIFYPNHCCSGFQYFPTMRELISFIEGYNRAKQEYSQYIKGVRK